MTGLETALPERTFWRRCSRCVFEERRARSLSDLSAEPRGDLWSVRAAPPRSSFSLANASLWTASLLRDAPEAFAEELIFNKPPLKLTTIFAFSKKKKNKSKEGKKENHQINCFYFVKKGKRLARAESRAQDAQSDLGGGG